MRGVLLIGMAIDASSGQPPPPTPHASSSSGEVVDEHGGLLPGVELELRSVSDPSFVRSVVADSEGRFLFPGVPAGAYTLKATMPGFRTAVRDVSAGLGQSARIRLSLPIGDGVSIPVSNPPPLPPAEERRNFARIPVFFATDRNQSTLQPLQLGTEREPTSSLPLGRFVVSVPRDHRVGGTERPTLWSFYREDPDKHFVILRRERLDYEKFYGELRSHVRKSASKQALVFIHGFNVPFEDAIYRTAQISYDIGFDGAPILYSWPSVGRTLTGSCSDRCAEPITAVRRPLTEPSRCGASTPGSAGHRAADRRSGSP
jgi:hypothetical protein